MKRRSIKQRRCQISLEYPLICELRKVCGKLEMELGVSVSLSYLAKAVFVDYLTCLHQEPPKNEAEAQGRAELQGLIYQTIGGYRPTMLEDFNQPITQEQGEQSCQSQQNKESAESTSSAPQTFQPSSE